MDLSSLLKADLSGLHLPNTDAWPEWPWVPIVTVSTIFGALVWLFSSNSSERPRNNEPFLQPGRWMKLPFVDQVPDGQYIKYRFAVPHNQAFGLTPGKHLITRLSNSSPGTSDGLTKRCVPVMIEEDDGYIDFVFQNAEAGGVWERAVAQLRGGDSFEVTGPCGEWEYKPNSSIGVGLLARGLGIPPLLRLAMDIGANKQDKTKVRLINAYGRLEDIYVKDEIDGAAAGYYGKFKSFFVLKNAPEVGQGFPHYFPYDTITSEHVERFINMKAAPRMLMVTCGDDAFLAEMRGILQELGYTASMRVEIRADDLSIVPPDVSGDVQSNGDEGHEWGVQSELESGPVGKPLDLDVALSFLPSNK